VDSIPPYSRDRGTEPKDGSGGREAAQSEAQQLESAIECNEARLRCIKIITIVLSLLCILAITAIIVIVWGS